MYLWSLYLWISHCTWKFIFNLEDEDLWLHVEFWALGGVGEHVDDKFAIHTLIIKIIIMIVIIIINIIIAIKIIVKIFITGIAGRRRTNVDYLIIIMIIAQ